MFRPQALATCLILAVQLSPLSGQTSPAPSKRRVAVLNFEYGTVSSSVAQIFGTNIDIGKGLAELLIDRLVQGKSYSVYERKALDKILSEQNFSNSDRADSNTAARIGRVAGVEAIVVGSITQFGRDDSSIGAGGVGGKYTSKIGLGNVGKRTSKAVVQISARLINVDTGEVLAVAQGKGDATRSGLEVSGAGAGRTSIAGGGIDMRSANFANTILGEAVGKAVTELAGRLENSAPSIPFKKIVVDAVVADVSGNTIVINVGTKSGVKVGDKLALRRPGREIQDPVTGKVIKRIEEPLGEMIVTEVEELSATGTYSGVGKPRVGDSAHSVN
jgi:curli biogenesis system outer membrane secretion channel CsgG